MLEAPVDETVVFEASSRDGSIVAMVGPGGASLGVRLEPPAMKLTDAELANRIVLLNTLAHLHAQLARRRELEALHAEVSDSLADETQVRAFERLIDF